MTDDEKRAPRLLPWLGRLAVGLWRSSSTDGDRGTPAALLRLDDSLARQNDLLERLAAGLDQVEAHVRPRRKPWYKRARTWLVGGLAGLLGSYLFNLPPEWRIDHFFALRTLQRDLAHYESFVPERCDEAVEELSKLRQKVQPSEHEFVVISANLGQCYQVLAQSDDARYGPLKQARSSLEQALQAFDRFEITWPGRAAVLLGVRRQRDPDLPSEMLIRLAEIERQLGGEGSTLAQLEAARQELEEAHARTSDPELQAVVLSNLGNVLNHLYVLERRAPRPLLDEGDAPDRSRLEQALLGYRAARELAAAEPALRRSISLNLAIQYVVLASSYAPRFEQGRYYLAPPVVLDSRPVLLLQEATRIFEEIEALEKAEGPFPAHSPLTDLLQPNFALAYRGNGMRILVTRDGRFLERMLVPREVPDEPRTPMDRARASIRRAEISQRSAQDDANDAYSRLDAVDGYRNAVQLLEEATETSPAYPELYPAVLNNLGIALTELGLSHGTEHLWLAVDALTSAAEVPNETGLYYYRDFHWNTGHLRSAIGKKPGTTSAIERIMTELSFGMAFLRLAAFEDTPEMLEDARVGLGFLLVDTSFDGPAIQMDDTLRLEIQAILCALEEYVDGRIRSGDRPAYYLRNALNVYRDYRLPPDGAWDPVEGGGEHAIPQGTEVTELVVRR